MESGGGGEGGAEGVGVEREVEDREERVRHGGRMVSRERRRVKLRRWRVAMVKEWKSQFGVKRRCVSDNSGGEEDKRGLVAFYEGWEYL